MLKLRLQIYPTYCNTDVTKSIEKKLGKEYVEIRRLNRDEIEIATRFAAMEQHYNKMERWRDVTDFLVRVGYWSDRREGCDLAVQLKISSQDQKDKMLCFFERHTIELSLRFDQEPDVNRLIRFPEPDIAEIRFGGTLDSGAIWLSLVKAKTIADYCSSKSMEEIRQESIKDFDKFGYRRSGKWMLLEAFSRYKEASKVLKSLYLL